MITLSTFSNVKLNVNITSQISFIRLKFNRLASQIQTFTHDTQLVLDKLRHVLVPLHLGRFLGQHLDVMRYLHADGLLRVKLHLLLPVLQGLHQRLLAFQNLPQGAAHAVRGVRVYSQFSNRLGRGTMIQVLESMMGINSNDSGQVVRDAFLDS